MLSAANERRIAEARDNLNTVLAQVSAGDAGGGQKSRRPFPDEAKARTSVRDARGRSASFGALLDDVLAGKPTEGRLARVGKPSREARRGLKRAGAVISGSGVHAEDRVLKKAMRSAGRRISATPDDLRAFPAALRPGGSTLYLDRQDGRLVCARPVPNAAGVVVKYVVDPASNLGGNRLVTALRVPAASLTRNPQLRKIA